MSLFSRTFNVTTSKPHQHDNICTSHAGEAPNPMLLKHHATAACPSWRLRGPQKHTLLRMNLTVWGMHTNAGHLPALESSSSSSTTTSSANGWDEGAAAETCRHALADRITKLDEHLSPSQRALLIAFGALVRQQLAQATQYSLWCEAVSYREVTRVSCPSSILSSMSS